MEFLVMYQINKILNKYQIGKGEEIQTQLCKIASQ